MLKKMQKHCVKNGAKDDTEVDSKNGVKNSARNVAKTTLKTYFDGKFSSDCAGLPVIEAREKRPLESEEFVARRSTTPSNHHP